MKKQPIAQDSINISSSIVMKKAPVLIGKSSHIKKLMHFIERAAKSECNVLLLGETGVGKEVAARLIHNNSNRSVNPFVKINCANLSDTLIESELFGHKKGAFTGAIINKPGLIEEANCGTLFLDEIADITTYLQAKLLSTVEDRELRRLGENRTRKINVRFILATNKDLPKLVENGKFRKDLYYRINVLSFLIAPLRERKEDLPFLIDHIVKKKCKKQHRNLTMLQEAYEKISTYSFPGNVRELDNILERAIIFSENSVIEEKNIMFSKVKCSSRSKNKSRYSFEIILNTLVKYQGNKTKAARELGISRVQLYRILNKLKQ